MEDLPHKVEPSFTAGRPEVNLDVLVRAFKEGLHHAFLTLAKALAKEDVEVGDHPVAKTGNHKRSKLGVQSPPGRTAALTSFPPLPLTFFPLPGADLSPAAAAFSRWAFHSLLAVS